MKRLTTIFLFLISFFQIYAQTEIIRGKVIGLEDNQPVIGASITVKGTQNGTITNYNGEFSISVVKENSVLVISYIGMKTLEVTAKNNLVIKLESGTSELEEVMVVAYGTTTKKSFTGAASVVKGEQLTKLQSSSLSKSLEGTVSGVQISSASGQPGSDAAIRIRGLGSISASQSPLIILDGVPYEGSLSSISSQDIETLNILKDAASNSMYGARGSNGVILITTKKGKAGKTKVTFESRLGVNSRSIPAYDVIDNPSDYYEMIWEAARNGLVEKGNSYYQANNYVSKNLISEYLGYNIYTGIEDGNVINPETGRINSLASAKKWNDNWLKDPFRSGIRQEYNINLGGGNEFTTAYLSVGYLKDKGYVVNSDFERFNLRLKIDQSIGKNIKAGANLSYTKTDTNSPVSSTGGSNYSNLFMFSQMIAPIYPVYAYDLGTGHPLLDENGENTYDFGSGLIENGSISTKTRAYAAQQNPVFTQINDISETGNDNITARGYTEISFLTNFKLSFNLAYDVFNTNYTAFSTPLAGDAEGYGNGTKIAIRYAALNTNELLTYNKKTGNHNINLLIGHESKSDKNWYLEGNKKNFWDPYNPEFANAGATTGLTSETGQYKIEGYLSRAEYNYKDIYYGSVSFRRDGSSKFAPEVRWGNFWSAGGAWRMKEESFLKNIDFVSNLKLKSSYGTQGNDGIPGSNLFMDQYTMVSDGTYVSPVFSYRGSPDLTWEKSNNFNLGMELGLFEKVNMDMSFFIKETKDMIYAKPLPPSGGSPTWQWDNQIDMKNTGFEIEINAEVLKTDKIKWDIVLNATTYKNDLTRLPSDKDPTGYQAGNYWRKLGGSLYDFYLYEYAGPDKDTGEPLWYTTNDNDTKETTSDYSTAKLYETGKSAIPDFYGGVSTTLNAYNFDFGVQTAFQFGGYVYDEVYAELMSAGIAGTNWSKDIFRRWTPGNTSTDVPRVSLNDQNTNSTSDRFLTDASYFSLRNITLGYTFPKNLLRKTGIESARIYIVGDNLLMISARKGLDPRQTFSGTTFTGTYSALRTTSVGLSVNF